jgi:hypothetical protein
VATPVDEMLIRRLLADRELDDFDRSPVFRTQVLDRPEAADMLVRLMAAGPPDLAQRARRMLCLFDRSALGPVARGLARSGARWRADLLGVLWTIISTHDAPEQAALLQQVLAEVAPLLNDRSPIEPVRLIPTEVEYVYRVCDQAYAFCQRLRDAEFQERDFREMDSEERDQEIRAFRNRLEAPSA